MMKYRLNKNLGQHFLNDRQILAGIAEALSPGRAERIVEIGPGGGALTEFLLKKDIPVTAVELDTRWAGEIKKRFADFAGFEVIEGDILLFDWEKCAQGGMDRLAVAGNIPYQITSPLHFALIENRKYIEQAVFLMQKEVAERIAATPGGKSYGIISIAVQYFFEAELLFDVAPDSFIPPPKVWSSVLRLTKKTPEPQEVKDWDGFMKFVKTVFNQRRKMIRNSLKNMLKNSKLSKESEKYLKFRPEQLSIEQLIRLYNDLKSEG